MKRKQKLLMSCPYCKAALTLNIRETHRFPVADLNAGTIYMKFSEQVSPEESDEARSISLLPSTKPGVSLNAELPYNPGWRIGNKKVERPNGDVQLFKILFRNRRCKVR